MQDSRTLRLDVADAAARLGITTEAVRKRIQRGILQAEKAGGRWYVLFPVPDNGTVKEDIHQEHRTAEQDKAFDPATERLITQLEADKAWLQQRVESGEQERAVLERTIAGQAQELRELRQQLALPAPRNPDVDRPLHREGDATASRPTPAPVEEQPTEVLPKYQGQEPRRPWWKVWG